MPIKIFNISTTLLVDSGSACSILNRSLAKQVVTSSPHAVGIHDKISPQLITFSNEPIHIEDTNYHQKQRMNIEFGNFDSRCRWSQISHRQRSV